MSENITRVSALIPRETHTRLRVWCVQNQISLQELVVSALTEWQDRHMQVESVGWQSDSKSK